METMELLEKYFDVAFAAPAGVKRLRELILSLAMQGKLVPQDPSDQPASELLKEIEAEKKRLVKHKKINISKNLAEIKKEEILHEIPIGWELVRLGTITNIVRGGSPRPAKDPRFYDGNIPFLKVADLTATQEMYLDKYTYTIKEAGLNKTRMVPPNTLMLTNSGATLGIPKICRFETTFNDGIAAFIFMNEGLHKPFFYYFLKSKTRWFLDIASRGQGQPNLNTDIIGETIVSLPPLAEQRRIVEKIDQLMCRCDELEKLQTERNQKRLIVHVAAKDRLLSAKDNTEFSSAWEFIYNHFGDLYSVKENVSELRKVILQLAVMGKLVPQDPNDEPASELLKKIEAEKQRLIKEGKIKKQKPLPEIKPVELPYKIPKSWIWCRVENVAQFITSGSRDWAKYYSSSGAIFVTMGNLSRENYSLRMEKVRYVKPPQNGEGTRTKLEEYDLLISITGDVGNLGLIPGNFGEAYINQHTCLLRLMPVCRNRYFPELMRTPLAQEQFNAPQRGIKNSFRLSDVGKIIIPLPPLQEQKRIVAKVDQLMTLCDQLEHKIEQTTGTQTTLLNAVMANL
jgi:type I restriction enzyme S subunit